MRTSLTKRIGKLGGAMMQEGGSKPADLSMLSKEELEVLEKVLDYTPMARGFYWFYAKRAGGRR